MILSFLRKSERPVSTALILCLVFEFTFPQASRAGTLSSGGGTVASSLSSMVDGYTGDFRYSVPLLTVPGPNGESVSIAANYRAGITVNQKASWMGLGWDYNPGEISRQVVNLPDDYDGREVTQYSQGGSPKIIAMFGSLYNNDFNRNPYVAYTPNTKAADNLTTWYSLTATERNTLITQAQAGSPSLFDPTSNASYRFNRHTVPYTSLAYDKYSVSGEGIGGSIHPYYLGAVQIHEESNVAANGDPVTSKKCQFYFENSTTLSVNEQNMGNSSFVNQSTNRIHSGTFVKYFTNAEININSNLYSSSNLSGYLHDAPVTNVSATRRVTSDHPAELIGAFQVTNPAGMTYHYSLPVYELSSLSASFDGAGSSQLSYLNSCRYASSWKLTAITGPDYEDVNQNYCADEGDTGYWIAYNYSQWSNNYEWASQRYNAKSDPLISPKMVNLITSAAVGNQYRRTNSLSFGNSQVYVLNYIRTATHTAYFVKSVRLDEQSYNVMHASDKPVASLKLDRVVLLRNEDKGLMINNTSLGGSDLDSRFDYTSSAGALSDPNFVNISRYTFYKSSIDSRALASAELNFNYSLAKKYTGNVTNTFNSTPVLFSTGSIYGHANGSVGGSWYRSLSGFVSSTAPSDNGKLTLKKITVYSLKGEKVTPSVDFAYNESSSAKNPDYNMDKTDLWGYYKNDYVNSHFVTNASKDDVDAWSLKEINTSLGGKIEIGYESDRYHLEGFNGDVPFYEITGNNATTAPFNKPCLIFPMSNLTSGGHATFYDQDAGAFLSQANTTKYTIYSQVEECFHPLVTYNNGNSAYYPPVYRQVVRYGTSTTAAFANLGTGPYTTILVGSQSEFATACNRTGYSPGSYVSNNAGVNHSVVFADYLYGGGVRVNHIKITDPLSGSSYTQKFEYGNGYCPVVPKPTDFSTFSGPSNHDVVMNLKPATSPELTGLVGYNSCKQYSSDAGNRNTGAVVQDYYNGLLTSPLSVANLQASPVYHRVCDFMTPQGQNCLDKPTAASDFLCQRYVADYNMQVDLKLNSGSLLGKLVASDDGVSRTRYFYETSSTIKETYAHPKTEVVNYSSKLIYPNTVPPNHNQCEFSYDYQDKYSYAQSHVYNTSYFLSSTETTKDDITIREEIMRASYTGAPYSTKTQDPTRGTYESTSDFAFIQTAPNSTTLLYPGMDLKSRSESNRNLLTAVAGSRTIKDGAYIISESKAGYSNVYPLRQADGSEANVTKPWYHLQDSYQRLLNDDVPASMGATSTDWRKVSTNTLYDMSYNCIEQEGLNGRRAASRWGYGGLYKLADISNANYNSFAFSGFEDALPGPANTTVYGGEITNGQTSQAASVHLLNNTPYMILPHSGTFLAGVAPNAAGPALNTKNFEVGRTYVAKVWVHKLSPPTAALSIQISGTAGSAYTDTKTVTRNNPANVTVGDWVLMSVELEVPANFNTGATHNMLVSLSNNGSAGKAYFDDLAFHPKDAVMTGNVYNEKTGALVAQLDNDNFATFYTYDNAMRLTSASKEYSGGTRKVTESTYHYAKP